MKMYLKTIYVFNFQRTNSTKKKLKVNLSVDALVNKIGPVMN